MANRSRLASRSVARLAERPPPQKSVRDFKVGFSFSNRVFAGAPSTSLAALGYLDFRKACFPGPVADILIPGPISGVWRSFVAYSNADDTCEPEVISAHTLQCGSAIPRAALLTREPFGRVGV